MSERVLHEWSEKPFHFRISENGDLWFLDESHDDEWWIADTSGACDAELLAEILRLRGLLEEVAEYEGVFRTPLMSRIRQALHREEGE